MTESDVSDVGATIGWSTDTPATSTVVFGEAVPPGEVAAEPAFVTEHSVDLRGLTACTVYRYSVGSTDVAGNVTVDDRNGAYFHFETWGDLGAGLQPCHQGRIEIVPDKLACGASVPITVADIDLNTDPAIVETLRVDVTSTTEPSGEYAVLVESGPDSSIFNGSITTGTSLPVGGDRVLQVASGDLLTATYVDADDGTGIRRTSFDTAVVDCEGPLHTSVAIHSITSSTAGVRWTTSEPTTGRVEWGATAALGNEVVSETPSTSHDVTIGSFGECERIYYRIVSTDTLGYSATADIGGWPFEFNAGTIGGALFRDGFESDTGWALEGEWEIDTPQGLGTAPGDPLSAVGGTRVLGHDLTGQGEHLGDFEPLSSESATSPAIDVTGVAGAELRFHRWLNVATGGFAYVEVKDAGGSWRALWTSPTSGGLTESGWGEQVYDVSPYLAGNTDFRVRLRNRSHITAAIDAGWNADELVVRDTSSPLYGSCGDCGGAPSFSGIVSATDDDPCADSGVTVSWSPAPSWGTGDGGTYAVYRDTQPGFQPSSVNRVAAGVAGGSWTDPSPPTDVMLYYVVRAESDETCGGGPNNGGLLDSNLIYVSVSNQTAQSDPGEIGDSLRVAPVNAAHVRLTWDPSSTAARYHVMRGASPDTVFSRIAEPASPLFEDPAAMGDSQSWFYRIDAADACGNTAGGN